MAGAGGTTVTNISTVTFAKPITQIGLPQANMTTNVFRLGGDKAAASQSAAAR